MSGANMLILDEPTNHLDIESKEVFEVALAEFPGTCLIVSHDRYFLNRVPTRIIELTSEGMKNYLGKYDYYVEKKQEEEKRETSADISLADRYTGTRRENTENKRGGGPTGSEEEKLSSAERRRIQKEKEARERRLKRRREALESDIQTLEEDIAELENAVTLEENMTDHKKLAEIGSLLEEKRNLLEEKYEEWLVLQEQ